MFSLKTFKIGMEQITNEETFYEKKNLSLDFSELRVERECLKKGLKRYSFQRLPEKIYSKSELPD